MPEFKSVNDSEPEISDDVWAKIVPILPVPRRKNRKGRPRMSDRQAMTAIWHKLRTGCSWKTLPPELGAGSTIYDRFQEWQAAGVFDQLRQAGILQLNEQTWADFVKALDANVNAAKWEADAKKTLQQAGVIK